MGLMGLYMGKVTQVRKILVGSAFFPKLVRPLVFSDPACAENRVRKKFFGKCGVETPKPMVGKESAEYLSKQSMEPARIEALAAFSVQNKGI